VDGETDTAFLDRTFGSAAALVGSGSASAGTRQPRLFTFTSLDMRTVDRLLRALAAATSHREAHLPAAS
jgi:hypothetical protein